MQEMQSNQSLAEACWLRTIRMVLTAHKNAVQVAFCAAIGDIAPVVLAVNFPKLGKPLQDTNLQSNTVHHAA